MRSFKLNI